MTNNLNQIKNYKNKDGSDALEIILQSILFDSLLSNQSKTNNIRNEIKTNEMDKNDTTINRCQYNKCKRKMGIFSDVSCKCGKKFCEMHRFYSDHECDYDHKGENIKKLKLENPRIVAEKFEKI
jgi:predicted nucleic acid binding AN1-type Zn finger protein